MTELEKLEKYLKANGYIFEHITEQAPEGTPEELCRHYNKIPWRDQIIVYDEDGHRLWDAVCHIGSYGAEQDLIEVMGDQVTHDDVEGFLTAEDIIKVLEGSENSEH